MSDETKSRTPSFGERLRDCGWTCKPTYFLRITSLKHEEIVSQKSEDNLALAESELDKHTSLVADLTRKVDELQTVANEAARLKDQVDEYVFFFSPACVLEVILQVSSCSR
jgi:hypothetical protein